MTVNTRLFPETGKVLHSLKNNGATIGIISTKYRYRILELVGKVFPEGFFNIIVGGEDPADRQSNDIIYRRQYC